MRQWGVPRLRVHRSLRALGALALLGLGSGLARAESPAAPPSPAPSAPASGARPRAGAPAAPAWSAAYPSITSEVGSGAPLTIEVLVPLCNNSQIWCGADYAGRPGTPRTNLYWGAIFGARTLFDRPDSGWARVALEQHPGPLLERAVYQREVPGEPWGLTAGATVEVLVVLEAVHGDHIDEAVDWLFRRSARGAWTTVPGAEGPRRVRVHAVGYAGHNRVMDGIPFPPRLDPIAPGDAPVPAFVLACSSDRYFSAALRQVGVEPLITTRTLMAPEGYVVDAVVQGLAANEPLAAVRQRVVRTYARWQRLSLAAAGEVFAPR